MGGYTQGKDPDPDLAVSLWPNLTAHIRQLEGTPSTFPRWQRSPIEAT